MRRRRRAGPPSASGFAAPDESALCCKSRSPPGLGQDQAFLGALGLQGSQPLVHGLEFMTLPHATHASGRDHEPALAQFVGDADLTEGRLLDGQRNDGLLRHAILQYRLLAADLLQCQLAAVVIEFLKAAVEAVVDVTHHLACIMQRSDRYGAQNVAFA
jgi:hypothetical protein